MRSFSLWLLCLRSDFCCLGRIDGTRSVHLYGHVESTGQVHLVGDAKNIDN